MRKAAGRKPATTLKPGHTRAGRRLWFGWIGAVVTGLVVLLAVGLPLANKYWPFRYRNVKPLLQNVFASQITIDKYHRIYFPSPGFVATGLTLRRDSAPNLPPLGTVQHLLVRGSWMDLLLLRSRVALVEVQGLQLEVPAVGSEANKEDFPPGSASDFAGPTTAVEELRVEDSVLDILRTNGSKYSFPIHKLVVRNMQKGTAMQYVVDMENAQPTGHIHAKGSFGPIVPGNLGETPLADDFTFTDVKLGDIHGIGGTLSSQGRFHGTLGAIHAEASEETRDFVVGQGKATHIAGTVQCTINGLDGEMLLNRIDVKIEQTRVLVQGSILGSPKSTKLDVAVSGGRVQDVLRSFLQDGSPIRGAVSLHDHVELDPAQNGAKFLKRLRVEGSFEVPEEKLTSEKTEKELSAFSARAQGEKGDEAADAADVVSSLSGAVTIRDGMLSTPKLTFDVPGASAELHGTFNLRDKSVHLAGEATMQAALSNAATGWKSALLKPLNPLFKRKHAGAVVPIAVTGTPGSYKVTQNVVPLK